ncbi:carbon-nitrogen hydrolase family protein [Desulfoscipio geothermicus]|uniref:Predicted amidohydrolase n=1 Tax=Desulfoscipio geothermicus DSM 3669 TaxID=1121426 RepID=A0A1I6D1E6_9FIRM|nr:carbon-nitrogen hydrolase family protein [Desulfoscipio geothermicus]SFQ99137.1 Predicted amidohydrolase [Desulfoscipio geothermicus DSM 3669]
MTESFQLAVCQNNVVEKKAENIRRAEDMIREAAGMGARVVVLPEMFNCPYETRLFPDYAEPYPDGETVRMLSRVAADAGIVLVGGSIPEKDGDIVYNTCFTFGPRGELLGRHRKVHLFDVDLPNLRVRESSTLGPGNDVAVMDAGFVKLGVMICFDVRFPELARLLALGGIDVLVVPAAFNTITGPAHWDLNMRARAVDNQVYVAAASPARDENAGYVVYGHSMVVDPWGDTVARAGTGEEIIIGEIDPERIKEVRARLPLLAQMRTDLYELRKSGR